MFRTILVPLDGSKLAEESLDRVRDLARTRRSKVILLRVAFALLPPPQTHPPGHPPERPKREAIWDKMPHRWESLRAIF